MKDDFGWLMPWYFVIVLGFWALFFDDPLICILLTLFVVFFPEIVGFILNEWIDNPWERKAQREGRRWRKKLECQVRYGFYEFDNRYESYKKMLKAKKRRAFFNFVKKLFFIK